jgi:hypothetical protein
VVLALVLIVGGAAAMAPWVVRNRIVAGSWFLETTGIFNLWWDNLYGDDAPDLDGDFLARLPPPEASRLAVRLAWHGVRAHPRAFRDKIMRGANHLIRPEGLYYCLFKDRGEAWWEQCALVLLDDGLLIPATALFLVFVAMAPRSAAWRISVLWTSYYLFMIVVPFHVEIRYRGALVPVVFAGAAGGVTALFAEAERRRRAVLALVLGAAVALGPSVSLGREVLRAAEARWALRDVDAALARSDQVGAWRAAARSAAMRPRSASPWIDAGRRFLRAGQVPAGIASFERAAKLRPDHPVPAVVLPRLLADVGRTAEAFEAVKRADALDDPALALAVAWRELPPQRGSEIALGHDDYGAVRGFAAPTTIGRWTLGRGEIRLVPGVPSPTVTVTVEMASPRPSPWATVPVLVRDAVGATETTCTVTRDTTPCTLSARTGPDGAVRILLRSSTWSRPPATPDQGVFVGRVTLGAATR